MRVELALIVGIVCFCCWCAYILINMNSTVAIQPQVTQQPQQQQQPPQQNQYQASQFHTNINNNNEPSQRQPLHYGRASSPASPMVDLPFVAPMVTQASPAGGAIASSLETNNVAGAQLKPARLPEGANTPMGYYTLGQGKLTGAPIQQEAPVSATSAASSPVGPQNWHPPTGHGSLAKYPAQQPYHWQYGQNERQAKPSAGNGFRGPLAEVWPHTAGSRQQAEPVAEAQSSSGSFYYPARREETNYGWQARGKLVPRTSPMIHRRRKRIYGTPASSSSLDNRQYREPIQGDDEPEAEGQRVQQDAEQQEQQEPANQIQPEEPEEIEDDEDDNNDNGGLPPATGTSKERIGARSFSEHQSSANERDRHGRPIRVHYGHLVNGRPAPATVRQMAEADFDSVANELDPDQQGEEAQDYDESPSARASMESGERRLPPDASIAAKTKTNTKIPPLKLAGRQRDTSEQYHGQGWPKMAMEAPRKGSQRLRRKLQHGPKDSHQHRLSESLSAQQWDDDAVSPKPNTNLSTISVGSLSNSEPLEGMETTTESPMAVEEFVEDEEMPDEATDLFAGTDKFPFLDSAADRRKRKRRKRQVLQAEPSEVNAPSNHSNSLMSGTATSARERLARLSSSSGLVPELHIHRLICSKSRGAPEMQPKILRNPLVKRSAADLEIDWLKGKSDASKLLAGDFDASKSNHHYDNISSPGVMVQKADDELPGENSIRFASNEFPKLERDNNLHDLGSAELTDDNRVEAAETLGSLEDLNIRVMSNPSYDGQQHLVPGPLPSPSWPPSSTYPTSGQTADQPSQHPQQPAAAVVAADELPEDHHQRYVASSAPENGLSGGGSHLQMGPDFSNIRYVDAGGYGRPENPSFAGSSSHGLHRKKIKRSKGGISGGGRMKYNKGAEAHKSKKSIKYNKAGSKKAKKKAKKKVAKMSKRFKGSTRGRRAKQARGQRGLKKGALYYKDKGYKKRGFKKAYKKVEAGDHKTYFDEFRDKDHNKRWKNSKDKYHYNQNKNWAGNDMKKYKNFDEHSSKNKKAASGGLREKSKSNYKHDY